MQFPTEKEQLWLLSLNLSSKLIKRSCSVQQLALKYQGLKKTLPRAKKKHFCMETL